MYNLLESGEWMITEACPELINALPLLVRDEKRPEDVLKTNTLADDVADVRVSARFVGAAVTRGFTIASAGGGVFFDGMGSARSCAISSVAHHRLPRS